MVMSRMSCMVPSFWLQPPRKQVKSKRAWMPPVHLLAAAALLLLSCLHYLAKPTGDSLFCCSVLFFSLF